MSPQPVFRFAPSPNGYLHLGHAYAALVDFELCRRAGGRFLLRIEDIDPVRSREDYVDAILADLAWLGLAWEEPVLRQSRNMAAYRAALDRLAAPGLVYPAFMSRTEATEAAEGAAERAAGNANDAPRDPDGGLLYPPHDRELPADEVKRRLDRGDPHTLRLRMDRALDRVRDAGRRLVWEETGAGPDGETGTIAADPAAWGDVVLARRDIATSYHLAVVVDDAAQGVTDVVRGRDLFHATAIHVLLQALLDLPTPRYHHHRLVTGEDGGKLAKSLMSKPLRTFRREGATPGDIRAMVGL